MATLDLRTALASCNYYPVNIDLCRRLIWFAEIDREMYRRAGFLAPKQAKMSEERYGFNLDDVLLYDLSLPIGGAPSHYIFISAFCCSTLLARLLDRVPGCLVLKEPSILGQLAMMRYGRSAAVPAACAGETPATHTSSPKDAGGTPALQDWEREWRTWAALGMRLLTRTFDPGQTVIVKPSDVGNSMCDVILENAPRSKAVLLSVDLRTFILSVLKMEDRIKLVNKRANLWQNALCGCCHPEQREGSPYLKQQSRVAQTSGSEVCGLCVNPGKSRGSPLAGYALLFPALNEIKADELNNAQKAAYVWLVTAAFWDRLQKQADPERLLPLDGEEVSENPRAALRKVTDFFGLPVEEERLEQILADPVLSHHAKFPGQTYDAAKRRDDRADWEARFGTDADSAMAWAAPIQEQMESDGVDFSMMAGAGCKELVA